MEASTSPWFRSSTISIFAVESRFSLWANQAWGTLNDRFMLFPNLLLSQWPGCCLDNMSYIGINAAVGSKIYFRFPFRILWPLMTPGKVI